jgi:hypothetical protein
MSETRNPNSSPALERGSGWSFARIGRPVSQILRGIFAPVGWAIRPISDWTFSRIDAIDWPEMAQFFSDVFRAPRVPSETDLITHFPHEWNKPEMVAAVEGVSGVLEERAGALILAASLVLTGSLALMAVEDGHRWLDLVAALLAGVSIFLLLDGQMVYIGRDTLGLRATTNTHPDELARRMAQKAVVISVGAAFLALAVLALLASSVFVAA